MKSVEDKTWIISKFQIYKKNMSIVEDRTVISPTYVVAHSSQLIHLYV